MFFRGYAMADANSDIPAILKGPALRSITERDVDLLLITELHASPDFRNYVLRIVFDYNGEHEFLGAWRGVSDSMGETDILFLASLRDLGIVAIMIEDKVDAKFQDDQSGRYRRRGEAGKKGGHWNEFRTCLCGPSVLIKPHLSEWDKLIPIEDVADWLSADAGADPRAGFVASALRVAVGKFERGGFVPDVRATTFWHEYQLLCRAEFSDLAMKQLPPVQSRNEPWPAFGAGILPKGVRLEHKAWQGHVDLTYSGTELNELEVKFGSTLRSSMSIERVGGSAAIRKQVPPLNHLEPLGPQVDVVRTALNSARMLLGFWRSSSHM